MLYLIIINSRHLKLFYGIIRIAVLFNFIMSKTKSILTKPDAETLAKLNHTDNVYLVEYRQKFESQSWWQKVVSLYRDIKKVRRQKELARQCGDIKTAYLRRNELDRQWLAHLFNEYRHTRKYADHYGHQLPLLIGNTIEAIDKSIAPVIHALNQNGFTTSFCCHGHKGKYSSTYAYIGLAEKKEFPSDMLVILDKQQIGYRLSSINKYPAIYCDKIEDNERFIQALCLWAKQIYNIDNESIRRLWAKTTLI